MNNPQAKMIIKGNEIIKELLSSREVTISLCKFIKAERMDWRALAGVNEAPIYTFQNNERIEDIKYVNRIYNRKRNWILKHGAFVDMLEPKDLTNLILINGKQFLSVHSDKVRRMKTINEIVHKLSPTYDTSKGMRLKPYYIWSRPDLEMMKDPMLGEFKQL